MSNRATPADGDSRKKRRQNVACDSCKLRRIKCDLSELLEDYANPLTSEGAAPTLAALVQQHPEVQCTNCKNKDLSCTTESIQNPTKPNKSGKRISQARKLFGNDQQEGGTPGRDVDASVAGMSGTPFAGPSSRADAFDGVAGFGGSRAFDFSMDESSLQFFPQLRNGSSSNSWPNHPFDSGPGPSSRSNTPLSNPGDTHANPNTSFTDPSTSSRGSRAAPAGDDVPQAEMEALRIWSTMSENMPRGVPAGSSHATRNAFMGTSSTGLEEISSSYGTISRRPPSDMIVDADPRADFLSGKSAAISFEYAHLPSNMRQVQGTNLGGDSVMNFGEAWRGPVGVHAQTGRKGKRKVGGLDQDAAGRDVVQYGSREPWHLWSEENSLVAWGRREDLQERLADRSLGMQLSRHLVKTYFEVVHLSFPAINAESFYVEWLRAGERSDQMTPSQECLCAVMEAWGARFSDNPVVLGLTGSRAAHAPRVLKHDGTTIPGTQARAHWGRSRLPVCNALADRARRLIDYNGLLRRPTVTGVQALSLYNLLATMTDQSARATDQYVQATLMHSAMIEQMSLLQLMWDSDGHIPVDHSEIPLTTSQLRLKQRRLFWTAIVTDALWAAGAGQMPKVPERDLEASARWLTIVDSQLPRSTFKTLAFFMQCYHRIAKIGRDVAIKLSVPDRRPGSVDIPNFVRLIREMWSRLKSLRNDVAEKSVDLMEASFNSLLGFSPINYVASLRLAVPFLLLLLHQLVRSQLEFRKNLKAAYIVEEIAGTNANPEAQNIAALEELHMQSVDILLQNCRSHIPLFKSLLPVGFLQTATTFLRVLIAITLFIAEVPTNEQGYPANTLGGHGWTWEAKQEAVGICLQAMYQLGWAWGDIQDVLETVMVSMERMTPSPDVLEAYKTVDVQVDPDITARVNEEAAQDEKLVDTALMFWPPQSIPQAVDRAMAGVDIHSISPAEIAQRLTPSNLRAQPQITGSTSTQADIMAGLPGNVNSEMECLTSRTSSVFSSNWNDAHFEGHAAAQRMQFRTPTTAMGNAGGDMDVTNGFPGPWPSGRPISSSSKSSTPIPSDSQTPASGLGNGSSSGSRSSSSRESSDSPQQSGPTGIPHVQMGPSSRIGIGVGSARPTNPGKTVPGQIISMSNGIPGQGAESLFKFPGLLNLDPSSAHGSQYQPPPGHTANPTPSFEGSQAGSEPKRFKTAALVSSAESLLSEDQAMRAWMGESITPALSKSNSSNGASTDNPGSVPTSQGYNFDLPDNDPLASNVSKHPISGEKSPYLTGHGQPSTSNTETMIQTGRLRPGAEIGRVNTFWGMDFLMGSGLTGPVPLQDQVQDDLQDSGLGDIPAAPRGGGLSTTGVDVNMDTNARPNPGPDSGMGYGAAGSNNLMGATPAEIQRFTTLAGMFPGALSQDQFPQIHPSQNPKQDDSAFLGGTAQDAQTLFQDQMPFTQSGINSWLTSGMAGAADGGEGMELRPEDYAELEKFLKDFDQASAVQPENEQQ